jgi:CDGSH-type Zn-finger protein
VGAITGVAAEARHLTAGADRLRAGAQAAAMSTGSEETRATLVRVADRLGASVIGPLVTALQMLERDLDGGGSDAFTNEADIADELHRLATDATRLRVRAPGATALQEATAALQDLACQAVAGDPERLEARRSELAALMSGLCPRIQSAPDGPYLVTNVPLMTDWLGVSLTPTPQAALCRCGASMLKPWCDGSHAQIGWDDAKSDSRVPDQLDRYRGIGVTIADNRGTCAPLRLLHRPAPYGVSSRDRTVCRACRRPCRRNCSRRS